MSTNNFKCGICGEDIFFKFNIQQCQACHIVICKKHYHVGLCERHYDGLSDDDKKLIEVSRQNIARSDKVEFGLMLGLFSSIIFLFTWKSEIFFVPFAVFGFLIVVNGFYTIIRVIPHKATIQKIIEQYVKKQKGLLEDVCNKSQVIPDFCCTKCGSKNLPNARFCSTCGNEMEIKKESRV